MNDKRNFNLTSDSTLTTTSGSNAWDILNHIYEIQNIATLLDISVGTADQ